MILQSNSHFTEQAVRLALLGLPYILSVTVVFLFWRLFVLRDAKSGRPKHLREPPGPFALPIIGNIHQLGSEPHTAFVDLAKRFGDVMKIRIGSRPVIVLHGKQAIHQALVRQSVDFAGRPDFFGFRTTISLGGGSLAFSNYDEAWKLHRKLADNALRHFTSGRQSVAFERRVTYEATELIKFIMGTNESTVVDLSQILKFSVSNVIFNLLFESRHGLEDAKLKKVVDGNDLFIEEISGSDIADFMPWLSPFIRHKMKAFENQVKLFLSFLEDSVKDHIENYGEGRESDILYYLMTLLDSMDSQQREKVTDKRILATVNDFFGAGLETVATTLSWVFLYAIYYPELQKEIQDELDEVVGRDRLPTLADRGKLPLTEAFLAEAARHSSVVPTTIPHMTTRDTVLEGGFNYFIPKDTVVFVNLYSLQHDPKQWDNPEKFNPRRFLIEDGNGIKLDVDKVDSMMRFGGGRRRCIGSEVAQMELFLFFTILLHQCDLRNVAGQDLTLDGKGSLLVIRAYPYKLEITRRS
ncbi:Cytochrome P450 1A5 [Holothuria leucospilota]|uniref:unspecific monooxygenase n=1 Tax=Holothuria leucospilota TaxID=206669 RepID=A0A9Q1C9J9_HOLLE|nr:Cytochrome P450 1A5 [Holothuria leucospilota]